MNDTPESTLTHQDTEHLRMLSIGHYVLGGLTVLCGFFPIIHLSVGIAMVAGGMDGGSNPPPPMMGWMFIIIASLLMVMFWVTAGLMITAGRKLTVRKSRMFCLVVAGLGMLFLQPLGLVLGIFTMLVLMRPTVRDAFEGAPTPRTF